MDEKMDMEDLVIEPSVNLEKETHFEMSSTMETSEKMSFPTNFELEFKVDLL